MNVANAVNPKVSSTTNHGQGLMSVKPVQIVTQL
mgnify:CR=1 FL=1